MKTLFEKDTEKMLEVRIVEHNKVDKRIDVIATTIRAGMNYKFLEELDLTYAPLYCSTKDPVNMAEFVNRQRD